MSNFVFISEFFMKGKLSGNVDKKFQIEMTDTVLEKNF